MRTKNKLLLTMIGILSLPAAANSQEQVDLWTFHGDEACLMSQINDDGEPMAIFFGVTNGSNVGSTEPGLYLTIGQKYLLGDAGPGDATIQFYKSSSDKGTPRQVNAFLKLSPRAIFSIKLDDTLLADLAAAQGFIINTKQGIGVVHATGPNSHAVARIRSCARKILK